MTDDCLFTFTIIAPHKILAFLVDRKAAQSESYYEPKVSLNPSILRKSPRQEFFHDSRWKHLPFWWEVFREISFKFRRPPFFSRLSFQPK